MNRFEFLEIVKPYAMTTDVIISKLQGGLAKWTYDKIQYNKDDGTVADDEVMDVSDPDIIRIKTETNQNGFAISRSKVVPPTK
jgi:hypothetical protein